MTDRISLPDRRPNATVEVTHGGFAFTVTVGMDLQGRPLEVFANCPRIGTDLDHTISDACVLISLLLQHGGAPELLTKSLGRVPDPASTAALCRPASAVGSIAAAVAAFSIGRDGDA